MSFSCFRPFGVWGVTVLVSWRLKVDAKTWCHFQRRNCCPAVSTLCALAGFRISNIWTTRDFNTLLLSIHLRLAAVMNSSSCLKRVFHLPLSLLCIKEGSLLNSKLLNNKGKEWFKLAHISCIEIDDEVIKDWSEIADVSCKETDEDVNLLEEP